jgi:probable HAF family extracellular repeat protein
MTVFAGAAPAQAEPLYHLVDLGAQSVANAINERGEVAGAAFNKQDDSAARWAGQWTIHHDLGHASYAQAIDGQGDMVGDAYDAYGLNHPMYWPRGSRRVLITMPGQQTGQALGISPDGREVVGSALGDGTMFTLCWVWLGGAGVAQSLGPMGGGNECSAAAVNDAGQIAGEANLRPFGFMYGFVYAGGRFQDVGTLRGGTGSALLAINAQGHAVGWGSLKDGSFHAVLWDGTALQDLGALDMPQSLAMGINDHDEVVGLANDGYGGRSSMFLYAGGRMVNLAHHLDNAEGWSFDNVEATAINNAGVITGNGARPAQGGEAHAFLLVPVRR